MTLTSIWHDRHPRPTPLGSTETLDGDAEVAVVGGGLTGLTTAVLLARAGKAVTLLEARRIGDGTTGGSTAKVSLLQGTQLSRISRRHPKATVRSYVEANREGQAWLVRFLEEHGVPVQQRAAYTYATTDSGLRKVRSELKAARAVGLHVDWRDTLDLPYPTKGGIRLDEQYQVDPMEVLQALEEEARAHGVHVVEGARVTKVRGRDPVRLVTERGTVQAGLAVIATNMPILDRGGFFARMKPARSYGMAFEVPGQVVDGMYLSADPSSRSLRDAPGTSGGSTLLVGGEGHTTGRGHPTAPRLESLRQWTHEYFPGATETHAWSAQDYMPSHGMPFVGPILPGSDEILVAGGYSKWGMTNAVAAALAISGRFLDGHMEWAGAFDPWSTASLRGLPDDALVNAEVGVEMVRGWLRPLLGSDDVHYDRIGTPTAKESAHQVSAVCTHLGGIVRWNDAERSWDCPLHGSRFDADGAVLEGPATCGLRSRG